MAICPHGLERSTCSPCLFETGAFAVEPGWVVISSVSGGSAYHSTETCSWLLLGKRQQGTAYLPNKKLPLADALRLNLGPCKACGGDKDRIAAGTPNAPGSLTRLSLRGQVLVHFTPLLNLPGIVDDKAVHPWSSEDRGTAPAVDVSSPATRLRRAAVPVSGDGAPVDRHVPLSMSLMPSVWRNLISHSPMDSRLSSRAVSMDPWEFCLLIATVGDVADQRHLHWIFTTRDTADPSFQSSTDLDTLLRQVDPAGRDRHPDWRQEDAEFLVSPYVPFRLFSRVLVKGHDEREFVESVLSGRNSEAHHPIVHVAPHWFEN